MKTRYFYVILVVVVLMFYATTLRLYIRRSLPKEAGDSSETPQPSPTSTSTGPLPPARSRQSVVFGEPILDLTSNETLVQQLRHTPIGEIDAHLFVIWQGAMHKRREILEDIASRFLVIAVRRYHWISPHEKNETRNENFLNNLWRLYSGKGGWAKVGMPLKVKQCGKGDFIAAIVIDPAPRYQEEHTAHGMDLVNHAMNSAKARYRKMAGGGFKVHGTFNPDEAHHDITLLFHRGKESFLSEFVRRPVVEVVRQFFWKDAKRTANEVSETEFYSMKYTLGYDEWESHAELALAVSAIPRVRIISGDGERMLAVEASDQWPRNIILRVPAQHFWMAVSILNGIPAGSVKDVTSTAFTVEVGGQPYSIVVVPAEGR